MRRIEYTSHVHEGLGTHVAASHPSFPVDARPLVAVNFVNPWNFLPEPEGDAYLSGLAAISAGRHETALTFTLLPGLQDYYREVGLMDVTTDIREVPHRGGRRHGFPHGDPLEALRKEEPDIAHLDGQRYLLIPTLSHPKVAEQARRLGVHTLEQPHADITNNKAALREAAQSYEIPLLPGRLLKDEKDLEEIIKEYENMPYGIWLKFPTGSGGDLVMPVRDVTVEKLTKAIGDIRGTVHSAFEHGDLGMSGENFWSNTDISPQDFPLVVEMDARNLGEVLVIGSNHFSTSPDGVTIHGYFRQITGPTGEFIGSAKFHPEGELRQQLDEVTTEVAKYNIDNGFYGVQGIDYFVIKLSDGSVKTFVLELNSRPIISSYPDIVGRRLGIHNWTNVNVTLSAPVKSMEEFVDLVGKENVYQKGHSSGVVPMAFRTIVDADEGILASPHCKLVILGNTEEQMKLMERLEQKGVKIGQTV